MGMLFTVLVVYGVRLAVVKIGKVFWMLVFQNFNKEDKVFCTNVNI